MVHSLYLATAGSVSFDARDDGRIVAIAFTFTGAAAGAAELSFNSTAATTTTDTTGVIGGVALVAGASNVLFVGNLNERVEAGERVFLHVTGAGNIVRAFVYTDTAGSRAAARRR